MVGSKSIGLPWALSLFWTMGLVCSLIPYLKGAAKTDSITTYTSRDGLLHDRIIALAQDSSGFLWTGSYEGLNYFDGFQFRTLFSEQNPPENWTGNYNVQDILVDPKNRVWFIAGNQLLMYDRATGTVTRMLDGEGSKNHIGERMVYDAYRKVIWLFINHKLHQLAIESLATSPSTHEGYTHIMAMELDGEYNLWIGHKTAVGDRLDYLQIQSGKKENFPWLGLSLKADGKHGMWIGSWFDGLWRYDLATKELIEYNNSSKGNARGLIIFAIHVPQPANGLPKRILLGVEDGWKWFDTHTKQVEQVGPDEGTLKSYLYGYTNVMRCDRDNQLWIGTNDGLVRISKKIHPFISHSLDFLRVPFQNSLLAIQRDPLDTNFNWAGTWGGGIFRYHRSSHRVVDSYLLPQIRPNGMVISDHSFINDMVVHQDGFVYVTTVNTGIKGISPTGKVIDIAPAGPNDPYYDFVKADDSTYWVATQHELYCFNASARRLIGGPYRVADSSFIGKISYDTQLPLIWVTSPNGLYRFDPTSKTSAKIFPKEGHLRVYAIAQHRDGTTWIDTELGMYCRRPGESEFTSYAELFDRRRRMANVMDMVNYMHFTKDYLWVYSNIGLYRVDHRTLDIRLFTQEDGLNHRYPSDFLRFASPNDSLCLLTYGGYTTINPQYRERIVPVKPLILYLPTNKSGMVHVYDNRSSSISLAGGEHAVAFQYTGVNLSDGPSLRFRYRLKGLSDDWVEASPAQREVTYASLKPYVDYVFEVQCRYNSENQWSPSSSMAFNVEPKIYQTHWFIILFVAAGVLLIYFAVKRRIQQVRVNERKKAAIRQQFLDVEMKALRAQMNPHFIFNCLNSIKLYALENDSETVSHHLTNFSRLIRLVLNHSKEALIPLESELQAIQLYVGLEQMRFKEKLQYELHVADNVDTEFVEIPPLLIQPYVENAIWHGLMNRKSGGKISVDITQEEKDPALLVKIRDNGVGRAAAAALQSKSATKDKSYGTAITEDRIRMVNDYYGEGTSVEIIDLYNDSGAAAGTEVKLRIKIEAYN